MSTETKPTEPEPTEPEPTVPKPAEPKPVEPESTEPKPAEPEPTEPKPAEPESTEPKPVEPEPTEPKPAEPEPTEPKPAEPESTEPESTEPEPTEPKPAEPEPTEPKPAEPEPAEPEPAEPEPTEPETTESTKKVGIDDPPDVTKAKEYMEDIISTKKFVTMRILWNVICDLMTDNSACSNELFDSITAQVQLTNPLLVLCQRMYEHIILTYEFMTEPLAYYAIVFDPRSIQYTIENMFYLSYLLQNGFAATIVRGNGELMVAPIERNIKDFTFVSPKPNARILPARKPVYMNKEIFKKIYESRIIFIDSPMLDFDRIPHECKDLSKNYKTLPRRYYKHR